jgi:threonine/homoserine/homoserine lactone efflux protein
MDVFGLMAFAGAYLLAVASPGPGVAAVVARALSSRLRRSPAFIAGFVVGDLIWFTCAATGLALIAKAYAPVFLLIKYAGAAYLLFLAYRLWTARSADTGGDQPAEDESPARLFLGSLALTLGNPKVMVFFLAILPTVVDLESISVLGMLELAVMIVLIISSVLTGYALLAARAKQLIGSPRAIRRVNRISGTALAAAAIAVAVR